MLRLLVLFLVVSSTLLVFAVNIEDTQLGEEQDTFRELELEETLEEKEVKDTVEEELRSPEHAEGLELSKRDYSTDDPCAYHDHQYYGCTGKCLATNKCPGSKYISNLCPNKPWNVKCCFTANSDTKCVNSYYDGHCIDKSQCPNNDYRNNYCPYKPADVKCCRSHPTDTCPNDGCGSTLKTLACSVKSNSNIRLIDNNNVFNTKGDNDGADAKSNIYDMCDGKKARRSSYDCVISGATVPTPGGWVCIQDKILNYVLALAVNHNFQVNTIAGACHSKTSKHYDGLAVDLQVEGNSNWQAWMNECTARGGTAFGPGNAGHSSHVHCQFS